jgi:putative transposase
MTSSTTTPVSSQPASGAEGHLFDNWFDPIEARIRDRVREIIQAMIEEELAATLMRPRYGRLAKDAATDAVPAAVGHRHGHRPRTLMGTFGRVELELPRARLNTAGGATTEWHSRVLRTYQRRTLAADELIASTYLAGTNTRRVRQALAAVFRGAVGKDVVSRVWRKVKGDWDAWNARSLTDEPIVRLILDGTAVRVRLDRQATSISLLVVIGVRADGPRPGARCSMISSGAVSVGRSSSSSMARRDWKGRSRCFGMACRCRDARFTSIATCSPMRPIACTRRSPPTTLK